MLRVLHASIGAPLTCVLRSCQGGQYSALWRTFSSSRNSADEGALTGEAETHTWEEVYEKKSPIEHVLLRPDTYVGSTQRQRHKQWILDGWEISSPAAGAAPELGFKEDMQVVSKEITHVPALYKIVDELLVNAVDQHRRPRTYTDEVHVTIQYPSPHMKLGKASPMNPGWIHVYNNGRGIPIHKHHEEDCYVPELLFGHLLTGSNFDDSKMKFTGGRNGYGAKLANIFSSEFRIDTGGYRDHRYVQRWENNMNKVHSPEIAQWTFNGLSAAGIHPFTPGADGIEIEHELWHRWCSTESIGRLSEGGAAHIVGSGSYEDGAGFVPQLMHQHYTMISMLPEYTRFGFLGGKMSASEHEGIVSLLLRRCIDLSACNPDLRVFVNGAPIPVRGFNDYVQLFFPKSQSNTVVEGDDFSTTRDMVVFERLGKHWEMAVAPSNSGVFTAFSLVNSIATVRGGTHVQYVSDEVTKRLAEQITKRMAKANSAAAGSADPNSALKNAVNVTPAHVRQQLAIFVNALVENPAFDSQSKETLTTDASLFKDVKISDAAIQRICDNSHLFQRIVEYSQYRTQSVMDRRSRATNKKLLTGVPKLDDANWAGSARAQDCTLILTEGDSAKALAVAGLSVVGRDKYGVYPLKGKLLNVRDASVATLEKNVELNQVKRILNLQHRNSYATEAEYNTLRYGKVMLMCDQDHDGSHIKGLFINFIHHHWPELIRKHNFVEQFVTPLIKVKPRRQKSTKNALWFYSMQEFEKWKEDLEARGESPSQYTVKYYKGLGTSTSQEGKEYFGKLSQQRIAFEYGGDIDDELIRLAFSKDKISERKDWLSAYDPTAEIPCTVQSHGDEDEEIRRMSFASFINYDLIQFSMYDNIRSIPSVMDGLKPGQRKILYASFKKRLNDEIKVAQLAGYVAEKTAYHHGEASLQGTIVNMAQDYVGSNNISLLSPLGQFGTRLQGGKDAASARYIYTQLNPLARRIFKAEDDAILSYNDDDGMQIEPVHFVPILPMLLVNGSQGIGTAWATTIPSYHPVEIIDNLLGKLRGVEFKEMLPWVRGFKGTITHADRDGHFQTTGCIELLKPKARSTSRSMSSSFYLTELPIGKWTEDYKAFLDTLIGPASAAKTGRKLVLKGYSEYHGDRDVKFLVQLHPKVYHMHVRHVTDDGKASTNPALIEHEATSGLYAKLKLHTELRTTNMHAFDHEGRIRKYDSPVEVLEEFFHVRLRHYTERKKYLLSQMINELGVIRNKVRFLGDVCSGEIKVQNCTKERMIALLGERGYDPITTFQGDVSLNGSKGDDDSAGDDVVEIGRDAYDYLLSAPIWSLTVERMENLKQDMQTKADNVNTLQGTAPEDLWIRELEDVRSYLLRDRLYQDRVGSQTADDDEEDSRTDE